MKHLKLILCLLISLQSIQGQELGDYVPYVVPTPKKTHTITQTEKGKVKRIIERNDKGQIIFSYHEKEIPPFSDWKEPERIIYAYQYANGNDEYTYEYNKRREVVKEYQFHSTRGLFIYNYAYDNNIETTYIQTYPEDENFKKDSNPYAFISKFKNFKQLTNSKEVETINSSLKTKKSAKISYDSNSPTSGLIYEMIDNVLCGRVSNERSTHFSSHKVTDPKIKKIITSQFEKNSKTETKSVSMKGDSARTTIARLTGPRGKDSSSSEIGFSLNRTVYSQRNGVLYVHDSVYRKYDKHFYNLIEKYTLFETAFKGDLILPIDNKNLQKTSETVYKYNKNHLLKKEIKTNYKTGKKDKRKYQYKIE